MERLEKEDSIKFKAMFEGGYTRVVLIVTFLALLEVIRLGLAKAYQEGAFGTVWIINPQKMSIAVQEEVTVTEELPEEVTQ